MNRIITLLGILLAFLVIIFDVANVAEGSLFLLLGASVLMIGIGVVTGR